MGSRLIPAAPKPVHFVEGRKSAGILDDFAVRKNVATKEGTIEQVPTNDNHIVNKKYVDDSIAAIDLSGLVPYTGATSNVNLGANNLTVDTNTFFVDATNNRVGIGTASPSRLLDIYNSKVADTEIMLMRGSENGLLLQDLRAVHMASFLGYNGTNFNAIEFRAKSGYGSQLVLATSGKVGIGTTSPAQKLHVAGITLLDDKLAFTQTDLNEYIDSGADGYLDLAATTGIRLTSATTTVTGDLYVGNNADADPVIVFDGDTNDGQIKWMENESYFEISDVIQLPVLAGAPGTLVNGMCWMEADGLHIYYNGAEKVVAGA